MQCDRDISSEAYENMVKCSLQGVYMVILVTTDFICGIYNGIVPLYVH